MSDNVMNMPTTIRPRAFSDIIGQPYARGVGKKIGAGIVSGQGYILSGPKGCGKTTLARVIAQSLNCENRDSETGDPCNSCPSCVMIVNNSHPYVKEINAAASRGINDIKMELEDMNYSISQGYRVYILDEAHMLTKDAFSVLLKPMEEPSENVVFIFTTTSIESIPETIISRSPVIPILHIDDNDLMTILDNVVSKGVENDPETWSSISDGDKEMAILSANGSARQAITNIASVVLHGVSSNSVSGHAHDMAASLMSGNIASSLSIATDALNEEGVDPIAFMKATISTMLKSVKTSSDALKVAQLAEVISQTSSTSSKIIIASRIAYCASLSRISEDDSSDLTEEESPGNVSSVWGDKGYGEGQDETSWPPVLDKKEKENRSKNQAVVHLEDPANLSEDDRGNQLDVVFDALFDDESLISDKWARILDDEDKSDIYIGKGGILVVSVQKPDNELKESLNDMFENVIVKSF